MKALLYCVIPAAVLTAGCVTTTDESLAVPALHKYASFDLDCPQNQLQISEINHNEYGVEGCRKRAIYTLHSCNAATQECTFTRTAPASSS